MYRTKHTYPLLALLAGLLTAGCSRDYLEPSDMSRSDGLTVTLGTDGNGTYAVGSDEVEKIMSDLKFFAFQRGGGADGAFSHQVVNLRRTGATTLQGPMRIGDWYLAAVAAPPYDGGYTSTMEYPGAVIAPPAAGAFAASTPMYFYRSSLTPSRNSSSCHEIWFRNVRDLPTITLDGNHTAQTAVARNVAGLTFHVDYPLGEHPGVDPEWGVSADGIVIKLHDVPTTLSWEGKVLPDKNDPATFDKPLQVSPKYFSWYPSMKADYPMLVIPAHRGSDFWAADGLTMNGNAADTLMKRITVEVEITHNNGRKTIFGPRPLPLVPKCNRQMDITLTLNTYMDIEVRQLPWNVETPQVETPTEPDITNCYIVKPGRGVAIPVKGVYKAWNGLPEFTETNNPMKTTEPLVAEVIWEVTADLNYGRARMEPGVIRSVRVDNPYNDWLRAGVVVQTAPDKQGSALVGIRLQSDPAGEYRWSYHIWSTDYDPDVQNYTFNGVTWMDRNLGACYGMPREEDNYDQGTSSFIYLGTYYDRGRKDPFPIATQLEPGNIPQLQQLQDTEVAEWDPAVHGSLIAWWTRYPKLMTGVNFSNIDMNGIATGTAQSRYMASLPVSLWGTAQDGTRMKKTIYDPCPEGWRVPNKGDILQAADIIEPEWGNIEDINWNRSGYMTEIGYFPGSYYLLPLTGDNFYARFANGWDGWTYLHLSDCYKGENPLSLWSVCTSPFILCNTRRSNFPKGASLFLPGIENDTAVSAEYNVHYPLRCVRDENYGKR